HTWENCHAMQLSTKYRTFLYCFEANGVRIVCPIAEREFQGAIDIVTPYGFSGFAGTTECPQFPAAWQEFAAQRYVCAYFTVHPLFQRATWYAPQTLSSAKSLFVIDLISPCDTLLARCSASRRRGLCRWANSGVTIV